MFDTFLCELREENKRLRQQKPKVSREFIIKHRRKLPLHIASYHDKPVKKILSCASTVLINMIKELGFEVED